MKQVLLVVSCDRESFLLAVVVNKRIACYQCVFMAYLILTIFLIDD